MEAWWLVCFQYGQRLPSTGDEMTLNDADASHNTTHQLARTIDDSDCRAGQLPASEDPSKVNAIGRR